MLALHLVDATTGGRQAVPLVLCLVWENLPHWMITGRTTLSTASGAGAMPPSREPIVTVGALPDPRQAGNLDDLVAQLRLSKIWAGDASYERRARM